ncbi:MAG: hypothetical protein ACRD38_07630, partial [Nitrososphaerales archaeon]
MIFTIHAEAAVYTLTILMVKHINNVINAPIIETDTTYRCKIAFTISIRAACGGIVTFSTVFSSLY